MHAHDPGQGSDDAGDGGEDSSNDAWYWGLDAEVIARTRFSLVERGFDAHEVCTFLNEVSRLVDDLLGELDRMYEAYEPEGDPSAQRPSDSRTDGAHDALTANDDWDAAA